MAEGQRMGRFWDERASEDAYWYVDSRLTFGAADTDRFWSEGERDLQTLLDMAGARLDAADDVVEIGCGLGRLTRGIAAQAATVRALDVSAEMLRQAQELNPKLSDRVTWIHGDGTGLTGIEDASADACVSHVVFQHIPEPSITYGYVREMGRVLRPGGWSAFQVSNDPSVHSPPVSVRARRLVKNLVSRGPRGQDNRYWLGSAVTIADLRAAAAEAGLEVESLAGEGTQYCVVKLVRPQG